MWDPLEAISLLKESMPRDAFKDMYCCMHFTDDFDEEWSDVYFDEKHSLPMTERHHKNLARLRTQYAIGGRSTLMLECG